MTKSPQEQLAIFSQGTIELISQEELLKKLAEKRPLRIKYGADPSASDLHLGHTVPLMKLKELQELGHQIVFIIGDFTARIGDPSHQSEMRRQLSAEEVVQNARTYEDQVFRILNRKKTEIHYNSEWFDKFRPDDFLSLTSKYTVARLLERDDFAKRFAEKRPIAVLEFLYPLLQGYDSIAVRSDVELGGTDQKFNLLVGRELQRDSGQNPQVVMTLPIIPGTDGKNKMSKSLRNQIALEDSPKEMFGKIMSLPDSLMKMYFEYVCGLTRRQFEVLSEEFKTPRELKAKLGEYVVSLYHDKAKAVQAREEFDRVFRDKGVPDEIKTVSLPKKELDLVSLLLEAGLVESKSEARRLVEQGGVRINQEKIEDPKHKVRLNRQPLLVQCGKRKFVRIKTA